MGSIKQSRNRTRQQWEILQRLLQLEQVYETKVGKDSTHWLADSHPSQTIRHRGPTLQSNRSKQDQTQDLWKTQGTDPVRKKNLPRRSSSRKSSEANHRSGSPQGKPPHSLLRKGSTYRLCQRDPGPILIPRCRKARRLGHHETSAKARDHRRPKVHQTRPDFPRDNVT